MTWWKRLLGGRTTPAEEAAPAAVTGEELYIAPRSETVARVEQALPGTDDIPAILELMPPPISPALAPDLRPDRDYAPDRIAEFTIEWPSAKAFRRDAFRAALTKEVSETFGRPSLHVRLPSGRVTYLSSSDDPAIDPEATALIAAWGLNGHNGTMDAINAYARAMSAWMVTRPEGFADVQPDAKSLRKQWDHAQAIIAVRPEHAAILAKPRGAAFDGRRVWETLHGMGIAWGDMDQFQWADPTHQTDYLFWAEVDDGEIGYALPERIADGRQHFHRVRFIFEVARSPAPQHVLGQMQRAAEAFAAEMKCDLIYSVDHVETDGVADLEAAVAKCVDALATLGVIPGSSPVCQLR